jgi:HEPN domain-containing protein
MSEQIVSEWIRKAEEDWEAIRRLQSGDGEAVADVVGFLAQQTAEKYLKAGLAFFSVEPDRMHDLGALLDSLVERRKPLEALRDDVSALSPLAVRFRYPGSWLTSEQAEAGVERAGRVRDRLRELLLSD